MPDNLPPSEFGFRSTNTGIAPPPHEPTPNERLRQIYLTGNEDGGALDEDAFSGGDLE